MGGGSCRQVEALRSGNEAIFNRDTDNWRPLFTIAEIAGGNWPGAVDSDEMQILADVGDLFAEKSLTKDDDGMPCQALVDALVAMPDRSWSECNRGFAPVSLNVLLTNAR